MTVKQNWFNTLNEALESEGLVELWPFGTNISYNETVSLSAGGLWISICRDNHGMYERPINYKTKIKGGMICRRMNETS